MKTVIIAAVLGLMSTAAFAGDFKAPETTLQFNHNSLETSITQKDGDLGTLKVGAYILPHNIGKLNDNVFASVGYEFGSKNVVLGLDYKMSMPVNDKVGVYGTIGTSYVVADGSTKGDFKVTPYAGVKYTFSDKLYGFGEVGYSWDASNSWANEGGYGKLGVNYMLTNTVYIEPSVIRTFDTAANDTNFAVKVGVNF